MGVTLFIPGIQQDTGHKQTSIDSLCYSRIFRIIPWFHSCSFSGNTVLITTPSMHLINTKIGIGENSLSQRVLTTNNNNNSNSTQNHIPLGAILSKISAAKCDFTAIVIDYNTTTTTTKNEV